MDVLPDAGEADRGFIGGMPAYEGPKLSADGARSGGRARTWFWSSGGAHLLCARWVVKCSGLQFSG